MVIDFTTGSLSQSVFSVLLILSDRGRTSPIVCFGGNREFLEYMTHNTIRGQYVS